ncbi:unnamed protein product [Rhodiola kirilowii]
MALMRLFLSQSRQRHPISSSFQSLPLLSIRFLSSTSDAADSLPPTEQPTPKPSPSVLVQPVSYAVKPAADSERQSSSPHPPLGRSPAINGNPEEANAKRNFEETVEAHARLGISQRRTDLSVNGTTTLPHGTGKVVKVAVFAQGTAADEAKAAGAYIVGAADLAEGILNGTVKIDEFDTCIATPQMIPHIQKLARVLGKHGLFPNAKRGTIVSDVAKAVEEARRGRISFRMDKTSNVHVGLGKEDKLRENNGAFCQALLLAKPAGLKKTSKYAGYVNSFHLCSTMGPGYAVSIESLAKAADQISRLQVK